MKKVEFNSQSGKSLIEILIVLVVGAILVAMAVTRMTNAQSNIQRQNFAREFKVNLERARFDAVKRRAVDLSQMARIKILTPTSYEVYLDYDQSGNLESTEKRLFSFPSQSNVRILGSDMVLPVTIRFDRFGNTTTKNEETTPQTSVTPIFTFCEGNCTLETATVANSNVITLSPTGTVAMLAGGEALPTFNNPTVTNVNSVTSINTWVVVREDNAYPLPIPYPTGTVNPFPTASPSPSPSPNPSASPSPSPSQSPSPSPSPSETPTPTPNVVYCTSGQKPALTGCYCKLPMTVRQNGKCQ